MSELHEVRLDRLEAEFHEVKAILTRLVRIDERLNATLPHLATKAERPGKGFLAGAVAAYAAGLAGLAALPVIAKQVH